MARMLDALRATPPREIGGLAVTGFEDLRDETGRLGPLKGATDAAARNVLVFRLGERARVALRPSGTEPKAKTYIEVCSKACPSSASQADWLKTCREVDELVPRLTRDFWDKAHDADRHERGRSFEMSETSQLPSGGRGTGSTLAPGAPVFGVSLASGAAGLGNSVGFRSGGFRNSVGFWGAGLGNSVGFRCAGIGNSVGF